MRKKEFEMLKGNIDAWTKQININISKIKEEIGDTNEFVKGLDDCIDDLYHKLYFLKRVINDNKKQIQKIELNQRIN